MALPMFFSFFWSRISPRCQAHPPHAEKDFMELSVTQAHDRRAMQYLRDARDIAAFEARIRSLHSQNGWW
ncbi:hypothetical protein [Bordetella sp. FB-8]|uniref:hypothetical protein n=1 Tax=Bordetella sp. FB-8 TaxID=1159870 RepID=UPI00037B7F02|nr:hypothetical protein [Bordetella sp. FB-8]